MIDEFKKHLIQRNSSDNTVVNYISDINKFATYIGKDLVTATQGDIDNYLYSIIDKSPSSRNRKLASIKAFYKYLVRRGILKESPAQLIECSKLPKKLPRVPETTDLLSVINRIDNSRDKLIFEILYCTGLRRFELIELQLNSINFNKGLIAVMGKGGKERVVPLSDSTLDSIKSYINEYNITKYLFPNKRTGKPLTVRSLNDIVRFWADKSGLKDIRPHRIRSHFCTLLYSKGADIKAIQDIAGHESINTTNIYTKSDLNRTVKEYNKAF